MVHVLVLKSADLKEVVDSMQEGVNHILAIHEYTYDEITVPTPSEMPLAINMFIETRTYEAILCIGGVVNRYNSPSHFAIYNEVVKNLAEFSSYYNYPVGIGVFYLESIENMAASARLFAIDAADAVCQTIKVMRQLNSLENEHYVKNKKHN